jgi:hypothetical protein
MAQMPGAAIPRMQHEVKDVAAMRRGEDSPHLTEPAPAAEPQVAACKKVVTVHVQGGTNLAKMDGFRGKSDPYVIVKCGGQTKKTKRVNNSLAPTWGADLRFVGIDASAEVTAEVWDFDMASPDDPMGQVILPLADQIEDLAEVPVAHALRPMEGCKKAQGALTLCMSVRDMTDKDFDGYTPAEAARAKRLLVCSSDVPDKHTLLGAAGPECAVYEYNFGTATFATIAKGIRAACDGELRSGGAPFETIGLLCHGKSGVVFLTETKVISAATVHTDEVALFFGCIDGCMTLDGRFDILGCDVASGDLGKVNTTHNTCFDRDDRHFL